MHKHLHHQHNIQLTLGLANKQTLKMQWGNTLKLMHTLEVQQYRASPVQGRVTKMGDPFKSCCTDLGTPRSTPAVR